MGILLGFAPWILYWVVAANAPLRAGFVLALAVAVAGLAVGQLTRVPRRSLEIGSVATFLVLTAFGFLASEPVVARWALPLSCAGLLLVALLGVRSGQSFVHEYAATNQPPAVINSDLFGAITTRLTWIWVAVLAAMTVSSALPPMIAADASMLNDRSVVSYTGYWLVPFTLLGLAALATRVLPEWMTAAAGDIVRKTTFVAYGEATIDELYYLAQEHANREVGAGEEAYAVKVGNMGTPLVGDDTRLSWPSTYKVRPSRR